ncbi:MAG TPA: hypothetical protein P5120_01690 [Spirochaetota bacterium]|nr:hypothetical protein [Spirochaetota bacterium]HPF04912.1 hypothetical protein [Spirochaetota bacterium]HPJ40973.1 hypothetical protein [Spirochaetota bacterium]HPR37080.1 hypothetical protein [Spirochaetota bacterium]HRX46203.1 hypothetical protein [Spirochaetota bacterium]
MMKNFPLIILLTMMIAGCGGKGIKDTQPRLVEVFIEQAGNRINIKENTAEIRRIPFSFIINFSRPDSIFINASFSSESFNNALAGLPLDELIGFRNPGIDEEPFNKQNILHVSNAAPNLWYYTDDTDHRFNLIKKYEKGIICQRNIHSIADIDSEGQKTELNKLKNGIIYLVIVTVDWNEDYTKMIEKSRKMIKLRFIL